MSRRGNVDEYAPGNEDYEYDGWRQRQADAESDGEDAARAGRPRENCPYDTWQDQYASWHRGYLRVVLERIKAA